ncbi:phosphoglycerate dehydrogenase [Pelosinus sp. sgz500959]|uniref:phosphoglycerate dehydrogenase n=1 Tax=Pelosinus sp. sgz500959 TaxID=3242472 RepID=UPI00366D529C
MVKVLVTARSFALCAEAKTILESKGYSITWNPVGRPLKEQELLELIPGMDALITGTDEVSEKVIAAGLPSLKVIAKYGVGYDNIDVAAAKRHGVQVTFTPGVLTKAVAELAMGLLMSAARNIAAMDRLVRQGKWERITGTELSGKTIGIVGTGNIGREVAKRAAAFEMNVIAYDVWPNSDFAAQYGVSYVPLSELFEKADFISLHTPSTPETVGMVNIESLQNMKNTAVLINTARGDLIVEEDLIKALQEGIIAGAGMDTFAVEPLQDERFSKMNNVVLSPHAGSNTRETVARMSVMAATDVVAVLTGKPPHYPVR